MEEQVSAAAYAAFTAAVLGIDAGPGKSPSVTFEQGGERHTVTGRIVVGADAHLSGCHRSS